MTTLRVADILAESVVDGKGLRTVVFFQGCPRYCEGCHNEALLSFDGGREYQAEELADLIASKTTPIHQGITFSGGDPLAQPEGLLEVIVLLKRKNPLWNYWVYTGYYYQEIAEYPVLREIDVLVDGPFVLEQRDLALPFKGSANQRLIDIQSTQKKGEILLFKV